MIFKYLLSFEQRWLAESFDKILRKQLQGVCVDCFVCVAVEVVVAVICQ